MSDYITTDCSCCDVPAAPAYDVVPELPPVEYVEPIDFAEPVADIAPAPVIEPLPEPTNWQPVAPLTNVNFPEPVAPVLTNVDFPVTTPAPAADPALDMIVQSQAQEMFSDLMGKQQATSMNMFAPSGYTSTYDSVNDTLGFTRDGDLTQSRPYADD